MKRLYAALGIAFVLLIAYVVFSPRAYPGIRVPRRMIPPAVVVSITQSIGLPRVFPGVGGAVMVLSDGSLWQWGQIGPSSWPRTVVPVKVDTNGDWTKVVVANNHVVGLRSGGSLWEWGWRGDPPAGGMAHFSKTPEQVDFRDGWVDVAAGDVHSVALRLDGILWAWGNNSHCQLGNGPGPNQTNVVQVGTNSDWVAVSVPQGSHTLALRKDGSLWVWGQIYGFRNGQPGATFRSPTRVCAETNWAGFGSADEAWSRDGQLWNLFDSPPDANAAVASVCHRFITNYVPGRFALAFNGQPTLYEVRSNGSLWEQTLIYAPQLMRLTHSDRWRQVGRRSDWKSVRSGGGAAMGFTADGTIWMWGSDLGQAPVMDLPSQFRVFENRIMGWFGVAPGNLSTAAYSMYQKEPRPILRQVPAALTANRQRQ